MAAYRERSQEQEAVQRERDQSIKSYRSVGYNLFCLELAKDITPDADPSSIIPVPSIFGSACDVAAAPAKPLCWLCGEILPSMARLNQHATDVHFNQWLAAFIERRPSHPSGYR